MQLFVNALSRTDGNVYCAYGYQKTSSEAAAARRRAGYRIFPTHLYPVGADRFIRSFFWFGFIKLTGMSPAGPLAEALTAKTVGIEYFDILFRIISLLECAIGILFLIPRAVRLVVPLLAFHMLIVCAPLVLVPELTWQASFIPTLEGQYIIKNIVIVALAFGVAAHTQPFAKKLV